MSNWIITHRGLFRTLTFDSELQLHAFVSGLEKISAQMNHHADLEYVSRLVVDVYLITHDLGGITKKDHALAESIDKLSQAQLLGMP